MLLLLLKFSSKKLNFGAGSNVGTRVGWYHQSKTKNSAAILANVACNMTDCNMRNQSMKYQNVALATSKNLYCNTIRYTLQHLKMSIAIL